jgi:hypothetical protein
MTRHGVLGGAATMLLAFVATLSWTALAGAQQSPAPNPTCGTLPAVTVPGVLECPTTTTRPPPTSPATPITTEPPTSEPPATEPPATEPPTTSPVAVPVAPSPPNVPPSPTPTGPAEVPGPLVASAHGATRVAAVALTSTSPSGYAYPISLALPLLLLAVGGYLGWALTRPVKVGPFA